MSIVGYKLLFLLTSYFLSHTHATGGFFDNDRLFFANSRANMTIAELFGSFIKTNAKIFHKKSACDHHCLPHLTNN